MRATRLTLLPLTLWLFSSLAMADTVYKWVDADGVTHYSDQPNPGAKQIDVTPRNVVSSEPVSAPSTSSQTNASSAQSYSCALSRPESDEVFLNTSTISARLRVNPELASGEQVAIALDGKRVANQPTSGLDFVIPNVERGTHTMTASIYDRSGTQQLCTTSPVTFHVRQPSVQAPVKAVRPKF
jgi:Domain of unknown function (DUF4124)